MRNKREKLALISRLDYGSPGFRLGLLATAKEVIKDENVKFVLLNGGVISFKHCRDRLKEFTAEALADQKTLREGTHHSERGDLETLPQMRARIKEEFPGVLAKELSELLPVFVNKRGTMVKTYIVTSPVPEYDGPIGALVIKELEKLRKDIVSCRQIDARLHLKNRGDLWAVLTGRGSWRSKYDSARPDRLVEDMEGRTSESLPDFWVTDCAAVSLIRPAGEISRPRFTVPGLHKLQETTTSESQVGIRFLDFTDPSITARTYSFKDFNSRERRYIPVPKGASDKQKAIFAEILKNTPTVGMLEDALPWTRRSIVREIDKYNDAGLQPPIVHVGSQYDIGSEWLQKELSFDTPCLKDAVEDSVLAFACLHAGYTKTQYKWFVNEVPSIILERGIRCLVGAGDFIAGLKHDLMLRGEIFGGLNYTDQQKLSASLCADVMLKVFRARFDESFNPDARMPSEKMLIKKVVAALLYFYFIRGNHDKWTQDHGFEPMDTLRSHLKILLMEGVTAHLAGHGLSIGNVSKYVDDALIYGADSQLPSGVNITIRHPEMGRMTTSSGRVQQTMWDAKTAQIVFVGNFHVAVQCDEWDEKLGQRIGLQVGTLVSNTDFEAGKNKTVDTGVAILKVWSDKERRIIASETAFEGPSQEEMVTLKSSADVMKDLLEEIEASV